MRRSEIEVMKAPFPTPRLVLLAFIAILSLSSCTNRINTQVNGPLVSTVQIGAMASRGAILAKVRSPITSTKMGLAMLVERTGELIRGNIPFPLETGPRVEGLPGSKEFSAGLTRIGLPAPELGTIELLVGGKEFFSALEQELFLARESVDLQL